MSQANTAYLRFIDGEVASNPSGWELPAAIAAIHWAKEIAPDTAFVGAPEIVIGDTSSSVTTFRDRHGEIRGRLEFLEVYPGGYYLAQTVTDNVYWYVTGPRDVIIQVANKMGYPTKFM